MEMEIRIDDGPMYNAPVCPHGLPALASGEQGLETLHRYVAFVVHAGGGGLDEGRKGSKEGGEDVGRQGRGFCAASVR